LYFGCSIAAYLIVEKFGLTEKFSVDIVLPDGEPDVARLLVDHPPTKTLPTMVTPDGAVVSNNFAIAESWRRGFQLPACSLRTLKRAQLPQQSPQKCTRVSGAAQQLGGQSAPCICRRRRAALD
jgi:hypothetical protein